MAQVLTANLSWVAVTVNVDGSAVTPPVTYNLYQGTSATALSKVQSGLTSSSASVVVTADVGETLFFAVTSVETGVESAQSIVASILVTEIPAAPTGLTVTLVG